MLGKYTVTVANDRESRTATVATVRGIELDARPRNRRLDQCGSDPCLWSSGRRDRDVHHCVR